MPNTSLPDLRLPDPNGFTNALAQGMQMRRYQLDGDRAARKEEEAELQRNELSAYLSGDRSEESLRRLAAASPETALAIEKNTRDVALATARTATATAQGDKARLETALQKIEAGSQILGGVRDEASYQWARARGTEIGLDTKNMPPNYDPAWVEQTKQTGLKAKDQVTVELQRLNYESQDEDRDARRTETNRHNVMQESKKPSNGMSITGYDAQGRPLIQVGGAAPFGKPAQNKLEESQIQGIEGLARLDEIERVADPKLLTYGNKIKDAALGVKSKLGGELDPDQTQFRNQVTDMRQSTMENLSRTIKDLTGAAMTETEVPRIAATVPTMDDAPDQFTRKLKNGTRLTRNAIIRAQIAREQGMDPLQTGIDLGDTKTLMNKREQQLRRHYSARSPGMAAAEADAAIEKQLRQEFGY